MGGIIWLASYPKSGNTWMRAFLHNLLRDLDKPADINELDQFAHGDGMKDWYESVSGRPFAELGDDDIAALRPEVHKRMTESFPDSVFVKTHSLLAEDNGVPLITMEYTTGAIYILRSPLDVAVSLTHHMGMTVDETIEYLADPQAGSFADPLNIPQKFGSWSLHVESWTQTPHTGLHVVRYEDMLAKPMTTFRAAARFLGLDPPRERMARAIEFSSFNVLREQEQRRGFREKSLFAEAFFNSGTAGQWRKILSAAQVEAVLGAHRQQMERFRYVPAKRA